MTEFITETVQTIEEILEARRSEIRKLEAARKALAQVTRDGSAANGAAKLTPRQTQALSLIESKPGITSSELSRALESRSYGWTVVKQLRSGGLVEPCAEGWKVKE